MRRYCFGEFDHHTYAQEHDMTGNTKRNAHTSVHRPLRLHRDQTAWLIPLHSWSMVYWMCHHSQEHPHFVQSQRYLRANHLTILNVQHTDRASLLPRVVLGRSFTAIIFWFNLPKFSRQRAAHLAALSCSEHVAAGRNPHQPSLR